MVGPLPTRQLTPFPPYPQALPLASVTSCSPGFSPTSLTDPLQVPLTLPTPQTLTWITRAQPRAHFASHFMHSLPGHFTFHNLSSSLCPICLQDPFFSELKTAMCQQPPGCLPRMSSEPFTPRPKPTFMSSPRLGLAFSSSHQASHSRPFCSLLPNASLLPPPLSPYPRPGHCPLKPGSLPSLLSGLLASNLFPY